jgi:hypothetical protein
MLGQAKRSTESGKLPLEPNAESSSKSFVHCRDARSIATSKSIVKLKRSVLSQFDGQFIGIRTTTASPSTHCSG